MCVMIFGLIGAVAAVFSPMLLGAPKVKMTKSPTKVEYIPVRYGDEVFYQKYVGGVRAPRVVTRKP